MAFLGGEKKPRPAPGGSARLRSRRRGMALAWPARGPYSGAMRALLVPVSCAVSLLIAPVFAQQKPLSREQALGSGERVRWYSTPERVRWAPDGVHYAIRREGKVVWVHPESGAVVSPPADARRGERAPRPRGPGGAAGGDPRVRTRDGDLWFGPPGAANDGAAKRLTKDGLAKDIVTVSPNGEYVSFTAENNLSVVRVEDASEWKVTEDGGPSMFCGILDWVYQEELYGRFNYRGHWWSPDSKAVAYLRLDEKDVKTFTIVDFVPKPSLDEERSVEPEFQKYPKAGDANPTVRLLVAHPETRSQVEIDLSDYPADVLVVRVGWTPDSRLLFAVQDRIQTWMDLNVADPQSGAWVKLIHEASETWVNRLPFPEWLPDGSFLWLSERTGYQHLYHYDDKGALVRPLTAGDWQVTDLVRVDASDGVRRCWFTATKDGAIDSNLYSVGLDGGDIVRLTEGEGRHSTSLNKDGSWFLDTVSSIETPPEVRLCKGDGSGFVVLDKAEPRAVETHQYYPRQRLTIPARDGYPLDATVILPPGHADGSGPHPIYLPTYSGPDAPSVRNAFSINTMHQYLAQQGCVILQVNVRSASGRGQAHTGLAYKRLGVYELRDLEDAVAYVIENHGGDPTRVAIDGWSYGGFMAAYALTHSKVFSLGISGAGVHDWQLYDTIYTERYMSTPQLNPEGYRETSVIAGAANLHGHLVLMHGARDDNVHLQNTLRLVYELQAAGHDNFELMIYPRSRHGVRGSHRGKFVLRAIERHLLGT